MEREKPKFFNDIFSKHFNQKANEFHYTNITEGTNTLNSLIEYVVLDYKFNRDAQASYTLLKKFEDIQKQFLEHFKNHRLNEKEQKNLVQMISEASGNKTFDKIRKEAEGPRNGPKFSKYITSAYTQLGVQRNLSSTSADNKTIESQSQKEVSSPNANVEEAKAENNCQEAKEQPLNEDKSKENNDSNQQKPSPSAQTVDVEFASSARNDPVVFDSLLNQIKEAFEDHRIEDAYEMKGELIKLFDKTASEDENKKPFASKLEENKRLLEEVDMWYKETQKILSDLADEEGFTNDSGHKNYTLQYKMLPSGKALLKMEGPLKIPLFNILAMMYEASGFRHWVPFCAEAKLIKPLHRASHVYWMRYGLPPPLTDRECHCFGYGVDRFDRNGTVLLLSRSIDFDPNFLNHYDINIPKETKLVRMDIDVATEFIPISKEEMIMRQVTTVDVKVKNTPPMILSWISRKTGQYMFESLIKKAKNLKGTMWEKEIETNKEFYGWLGQKVDKFLKEHELA